MVYRMTQAEQLQVYGESRTQTKNWLDTATEPQIADRKQRAKWDMEDAAHNRDSPNQDQAMEADWQYHSNRGVLDAIRHHERIVSL